MTSCQACGSEIIGRDRFCRKCGAPTPVSVTDMEDTRRFNPAVHSPSPHAPGSGEFTAPFYAPPSAYPAQHGAPVGYHTGQLPKKYFPKAAIWLVTALVLSVFIAISVAVAFNKSRPRSRRSNAAAVEISRSFQDTIRNGLGMRLGNKSDSEFPDIPGVLIDNLLTDDSPAALAKLQAGDVLMELNNRVVRNSNELGQLLETIQPGSEVPVKFYRDGETMTSSIKLADFRLPLFVPELPQRDQGLLGVGSDIGTRRRVPGINKWGVALSSINDNGPADLAGLQRGDIITEFDGHPIRTRNELERRIRAAKPRVKVPIKFYRGNVEQTVDVLMGHH